MHWLRGLNSSFIHLREIYRDDFIGDSEPITFDKIIYEGSVNMVLRCFYILNGGYFALLLRV